ncbi:MAG: OpgC domain-containing protein, partial [Alphaproteobacteria bacterium]|nr:OpgC domain-containing protein [Alphaproteobacteria bacterium]
MSEDDRSPPPTSKARRERDLRLDFFRGLALFFIFIDHIPENTLSYFTMPSVGFSDAAEIFIFISGFTAAMVYGRTLLRQGLLFATAQIYRRVWQLYVAHVFLFVIFTAEVSYTVMMLNNPMYSDEMRVGDFLTQPHVAIIKALMLQFQPTFLDILPLYIVLLASFPIVLLLLRQHVLAALLPSLALYAAAQIFALAVRAYPEDRLWFFNPLAWQLLFVLGAAFGFARARHRTLLLASPWWVPIAALIVALSAVINLSWTIHGVWDAFPGLLLRELWPVNKNNLAFLRLITFFSLVVVVAVLVPARARFLSVAASRPILACGRQS